KAILTCRTHYFKTPHEIHDMHKGTELFQLSRSSQYEIAYIQPLNEAEIERIVTVSCGDAAPAAMARVRSTYDLMGLARRPILLQMITAVISELANSSAPEPINNARLYHQYVNQWLLRDDWRVKLNRKTRRSFTIAFATEMYTQDRLQFTLEELRAAIRRHFAEASPALLDDYENDIRVCSFIRLDGEYFEFAHRSFVEYFVALHLYGDIVQNDQEHLSRVRFTQEILSFLSQQLATQEVQGNVRRWLENAGRNDTLAANTLGLLRAWDGKLTGRFKRLAIVGVADANTGLIECDLIEVLVRNQEWLGVHWQDLQSSRGQWFDSDWQDCVLENVRFIDDEFSGVNFRRVKFGGTKWQRCTFHNSAFDSLDIGELAFQDCSFKDCRFTLKKCGIRANNCTFERCYFGNVKELSACQVNASVMEQLDLSSAHLIGTVFTKTVFKKVRLSRDCLEGTQFVQAEFIKVRLDLTGSRRWRTPPEFLDIKGLPAETVTGMKKLRAAFGDKLPSCIGE
ncbi:MAG: hypothetical protein ACYC6Y_25335, partial [Thermoguttaceae bacterium]